jgi:hypothetical protein
MERELGDKPILGAAQHALGYSSPLSLGDHEGVLTAKDEFAAIAAMYDDGFLKGRARAGAVVKLAALSRDEESVEDAQRAMALVRRQRDALREISLLESYGDALSALGRCARTSQQRRGSTRHEAGRLGHVRRVSRRARSRCRKVAPPSNAAPDHALGAALSRELM